MKSAWKGRGGRSRDEELSNHKIATHALRIAHHDGAVAAAAPVGYAGGGGLRAENGGVEVITLRHCITGDASLAFIHLECS